MGKSITTDQWKDHLYAYFEKNGGEENVKALNTIDWQVSNPVLHPTWLMLMTINKAWPYGGGLDLPVKMEYDLTLAKKAYKVGNQWDAASTAEDILKLNFTQLDLQDVSSTQICIFSSALKSSLKTAKRLQLDWTKTAKDWTCSLGLSVLRLED